MPDESRLAPAENSSVKGEGVRKDVPGVAQDAPRNASFRDYQQQQQNCSKHNIFLGGRHTRPQISRPTTVSSHLNSSRSVVLPCIHSVQFFLSVPYRKYRRIAAPTTVEATQCGDNSRHAVTEALDSKEAANKFVVSSITAFILQLLRLGL